MTFHVKGQTTANGEIIADTNNLVVVKVWGTHYERGYALGHTIGDKIRDVIINYVIPRFGVDYQYARSLVSNGENLVIDSIYREEAQAMVEGMHAAGVDTTNVDYIAILVGNCFSDLGGYLGWKEGGPGCSCFMNWGEATEGSFLFGKSIMARFYDWGYVDSVLQNNNVMVIHDPSETDEQPWLLVGYAGEMVPSGGGVSQGGLSMYKNSMSDYYGGAMPDSQYAPYQFTMRKILETNDFNNDGVHNTQDARDGFNANPQGYPVGKIIPVIARNEGNTDSLTAMVAEIAPTSPTHVYRTNSYPDSIPGDNLYVANSQIARNNMQNYCTRYLNVSNNMGDGTNIGILQNYNVMVNYSTPLYGVNYGFIQHVPELDILKVSVLRNSNHAYLQPMTTFDLRDFFNHSPSYTSLPVDTAWVGLEYTYLVESSDPDPYDVITINAEQLPSWLSLTDNGDGTARLHGVPDSVGIDSVTIIASDGMAEVTQKFGISKVQPTSVAEFSEKLLSINPNPFRDVIHITTEKDIQARVFSMNGDIVHSTALHRPGGSLDLGFLPSGIYMLLVDDGTSKASRKIIKY